MESSNEILRCHICAAAAPISFPNYGRLARVTSDCAPWPAGGALAICSKCGSIQKSIDAVWRSEISQIYANYRIYHQSNGAEQPVFTADGGRTRSCILASRLTEVLNLSPRGRLLDVGCGNGAFIREFGRVRNQWTLSGSELNEINRSVVESIPNVESFYTCPLPEISRSFDLITMVHVLEHIPDPKVMLSIVREMLTENGRLIIEVPDCIRNPFDLLVADHSTHFTAGSLRRLIEATGFQVEHLGEGWIPKELTLVARPSLPVDAPSPSIADDSSCVEAHLRLLEETIALGRKLEQEDGFGVFGTSIAGVWLFGALSGSPKFFVDEDLQRAGRDLMGRPVFSPEATPSASHVLIALPPPICNRVAEKMTTKRPDVFWVTPE